MIVKKYGKELVEEFKSSGVHENFCLVPFTTLQLEANGNVNVCRQKGTEFSVGNIHENTIEEIWNGKPLQDIRKEFIENKITTCKSDIKYKNCNLCPENNEIFKEVEISVYQTKPIQRLGFNINGKCNLECQMCHVWKMPNGLYNEENFWSYAREKIFPTLKEVELLSGEPFIQKDTYKLIDELGSVNKECRWIITTNAHWKLNTKIKKELDKILIRNIIVSIDSLVPSTYAKIRQKGDLNFVLSNLEALFEYEQERLKMGLSPLGIRINYLIQKDNWHEVREIFEFHKIKKQAKSFITFLYEPSEYSLLDLSDEKKQEILEFYLLNFNKDEISLLLRVIRPVVDSLPKKLKIKYWLEIENKLK